MRRGRRGVARPPHARGPGAVPRAGRVGLAPARSLAWHGLAEAEGFVLALHDPKHPLVEALQWTEPHWFPPGELLPGAAAGERRASSPCRSARDTPDTPAPGLLLVASPVPELSADAPWLAGHLGMHLTRLDKGRQLARLEAASSELAARVNAATEELATQNELLRRRRSSSSRRRRQVAVPRQHVARAADAAQRDPRLHHMLLQGVAGERLPQQAAARSASTPTAATCWRSSTRSSTSPASRRAGCRCKQDLT